MKNNVPGWILFAVSLPAVILGHLYILIVCSLFLGEWGSIRYQGAGVITTRWRAWFAKRWRYSTTLGRGIAYSPAAYDESVDIDNRTEMHEFVHIRQFENCNAMGFLGGLVIMAFGNLALGLNAGEGIALWMFVWALSTAFNGVNNLTAMLVYGWKGFYRDAEHERSAYAQTDMVRQLKADGKIEVTSWDEIREEQRAKATSIG